MNRELDSILECIKPAKDDAPDVLAIKRELRAVVLRELKSLEVAEKTKRAAHWLDRIKRALFPN